MAAIPEVERIQFLASTLRKAFVIVLGYDHPAKTCRLELDEARFLNSPGALVELRRGRPRDDV